jgi:hypothetical protein
MVQAPYAPPLIPEASNRKTKSTEAVVAVVVPFNSAGVVVQVPAISIGAGKRRRPPATEVANAVEAPVEVPKAARPCRETRRVGRARVGRIPTTGGRLDSRAFKCSSDDTRLPTTIARSIRIRVKILHHHIPLPIRRYMPPRRT